MVCEYRSSSSLDIFERFNSEFSFGQMVTMLENMEHSSLVVKGLSRGYENASV